MALPTAAEIKVLPTSELIVVMMQLHTYSLFRKPRVDEFDEVSPEELQELLKTLSDELDRRVPVRVN